VIFKIFLKRGDDEDRNKQNHSIFKNTKKCLSAIALSYKV